MITLEQLQASKNIVELLEPEEVAKIGSQVIRGYELDEESRAEWKENVEKAMMLAEQVMETKNHPWPGASNIKFPIITNAANNYAARTMPEIIQNDHVVKCAIIGEDPDGSKYKRSIRVATYMSDQFVNQIHGWENSLDHLLKILAVAGTVFTKTYYNPGRKEICSELCLPDKIIVNHDTQTLEKARRITHILVMSQNDIVERQRSGIFDDEIKIESLRTAELDGKVTSSSNSEDEDFEIQLHEQHCFLDLDGDGYREPYVVVVHRVTRQVLRIYHRFDTIKRNSDGEVQYIKPIEYFTDFHFLRSSDGGYYSKGFGTLLMPLNASVNTILNQLVNAGTLATTSTGLISRGLRIKNGEFRLKMGEMNVLDAAGTTDISKAVFMMPYKEPSEVLYKLLEMLIKICEDVSSTTDVTQGKQPTQNVSSGVASQQLEQATKIFGGINKRVYRSLKNIYEKVYKLNYAYLDNKSYKALVQDPDADVKKDFEIDTLNVYPIADPTMSTINQRLNKAIAIMQLKTVDPRAADTYLLEALQIDKSQISLLLPQPDPKAPPPPETQKILADIDLIHAQIAKLSADATLEAENNKIQMAHMAKQAEWTDAQIQESATRNWKSQKDAVHNDQKLSLVNTKMQGEQAYKVAHLQLTSQQQQANSSIQAMGAQTQATKVASDAQLGAAKIVVQAKQHNNDLEHQVAKTILESQADTEDKKDTQDDISEGGAA